MRINSLKAIAKTALRGAAVLLCGAGMAAAQQQVNLTAGPATLTLPDGQVIPMWGYTCTGVSGTATCAKANSLAAGWSPVVITIPTGQNLQINLTNSLSFAGGNTVPTSLTIVGQLGGGLGTGATSTPSPDHTNAQTTTWPISDPTTGATPPSQGPRVQSFATEVAAGATTSLTWTAPNPGTYLIESGTHPSIQGPMGLYGILVVTSAPSGAIPGTAYSAAGSTPAVTYNADVPLIFGEIDPIQNNTVSAAVNTSGFSETMVWSGQPGGCGNPASGTYLQCYPPAVNYTPLYYTINGVAFDKTHAATSLFPTTPATGLTPTTGQVLVRMVNAGLRMHIPSIVGSQTGATPKGGFSLIAEDGNPLPGIPRVQSEVFMAAGKTYDVMINVPSGGTALPIFDRQLSLSANAINRDAGMLAYISVNGAALPAVPSNTAALAVDDTYPSLTPCSATPCPAFAVSDPSKGVIANDTNVYGVKVLTAPTQGTVTLNADGTFSYVPSATGTHPDSFVYQANGNGPTATVHINAATLEAAGGITCTASSFTSSLATSLKISNPGILENCKDAAGFPLTVNAASVAPASGLTLTVDQLGGFTATVGSPGPYTFSFKAQNSQGVVSSAAATVTLTFPNPSNLSIKVLDGNDKATEITDYRWIIEEDRTFFVDPACIGNPPPSGIGCPVTTGSDGKPVVPNFAANFHTSFMPVVASGCTGDNSCGANQTILGSAAPLQPATMPSSVGLCTSNTPAGTGCLDPRKRYYISVLPGDAAQPFIDGYAGPADCAGTKGGECGHGMGGAPIPAPCRVVSGTTCTGTFAPVTVLTEPSPYPPATLAVFVFEDDYPLNGEHDAGGGIDVLSPNEPGLGGFQITLADDAGGTGDATGTPTYDMFNMPLTNSLAGTIDPVTKMDACPISTQVTANAQLPNSQAGDCSVNPNAKACQKGVVGMIVTCPKYESDGKTLSPLAGQALVNNLYQGRYGVIANPGADRLARGEEWLQTNTLDGQKAHDSFMRIGEPGYFQEFGPAGYHVTIGFANPAIINARKGDLCGVAGSDCTHEVKGHITTARMSRTPDERLYGSGTHDSYGFTQCYVSIGDPDGAEFGFTKCDGDGNFDFTGIPAGNWKITTFDQWNDQVVDGITTAVGMCDPQSTIIPAPPTNCKPITDMGEVGVHQWQANVYTRTFIDLNHDGISDTDTNGNLEPGLPLASTNIRFRDGSFSNFNNTDLEGFAGFNEVFPLFNWYVIETDSTDYKNTGTHVVYDAGGPADGTSPGGTACSNTSPTTRQCGTSTIAANLANTYEPNPLPADLSLPGSVYCTEADCNTGESIANGPTPSAVTNHSTGRIDGPWVNSYGWQGYSGQNSFLEFGKAPFAPGENGGIHGHVVYASTRPFDDPQLLLQTSWMPQVPHVRINLYQEGVAADGVTKTLTLVDHTETSSFDDWVQGFRKDTLGNPIASSSGGYIPNISCPGQGTDSPTTSSLLDPYFWATLKDQPQYLDLYNHPGASSPLAHDSQFKCYDGMHNWNQLQPAPYDGMYSFPSVTGIYQTTGNTTGTNCTICTKNPDPTDAFRFGKEDMLPAGKYVVEVVVPPGYELVKEEDKNILIGDNFIAPVVQQFGGLASIFILPDQAEIASAYNANNPLNPTDTLGRDSTQPSHEGDTGSVETFWPCVGALRTVPDFISLFPGSGENSPFAGATRPLCDRKEVALTNQSSVLTKFFIFTPTHTASHFTGVITDDFTAEFDPFSPQFGEKFGPAYLPIGWKDWAGNEINRIYSDAWGAYNGLSYSTWEVNPPNPTGYGPTMLVGCMNDAGSGPTPDPLFQGGYSQFCYELPFMPGQTGYFDTPVVPTSAFAGDYNTPDCAYANATPAVKEVDGDGVGPWVSAAGHTLHITALGDQMVDNYNYSGPNANVAPFNKQKVLRHYGFGATAGTVALVGGDGVAHPLTGVSWGDGIITGNVPTGVPDCAIQQQLQYSQISPSARAQCGELVITTAAGKISVDTVTVTIGGKAPTRVASTAPMTASGVGAIQIAIDNAMPGDLIIVPPGNYSEMLLMWKPVRLQGVGAASSIIDANPHPAGKLDPWRRRVLCLFGLALNGTPILPSTANPAGNQYDPSSTFTCPANMQFSVDRLPLEATVGWDATLNGNLAEQLIEPTLMGAYEGAGITVLGKGVYFPNPGQAFDSDVFPADTQLLLGTTNSTRGCGPNSNSPNVHNPYPSNFLCNPSSIDGLTVKNSSQGGGGIMVHAWGHELQIANNRVLNNQGTLSGGITVGQGEHPDAYLAGGIANTVPGSCITNPGAAATNLALPYCFDMDVNVHHNAVTANSSLGDELFSSTPAGAGGVTFCNGSDYYKFNYNWVCGNMSTGDGAGVAHIGFTYDGDIEHNTILFNQSTNPTIATNGGGLLIMGAPDQDPPCATNNDTDCVSPPNTITPSDGTGPGLVINANLIVGNSADAGSGGGLRLQHINGNEVINFPNGNQNPRWPSIHGSQPSFQTSTPWNAVSITNNIIANNVAGWDGGGVSMLDALATNFINNTVATNNSTASSGVLFQTLFAPLASTGGTNCINPSNASQSCPQPAGLVSVGNSAVLKANLPTSSNFACPTNHGTGTGINATCRNYSIPELYNDLFWQNRAVIINVGGLSTNNQGLQGQNNTVVVDNPNGQPTLPQTTTGQCNDATNSTYWDLGVRGDTGPGNHTGGTLVTSYSALTNSSEIATGSTNDLTLTATTTIAGQYCNGSRVPPEASGILNFAGWQAPPGTNESNALPAPPFTLAAAATVDEGNNWINLRWGPLSLNTLAAPATLNASLQAGSPAINRIPNGSAQFTAAPNNDFYGNARKVNNNPVDVGAVEFVLGPNTPLASVTPTSLSFGSVATGTTSAVQNLTLSSSGTAPLSGIVVTVTAPFARSGGTCGTTLGTVAVPAATCTIGIVFSPTTTGAKTGTVTITSNVGVSGSPVPLTGTGATPTVSATLTPTARDFGTHARTCPGTTFAQILACTLEPTQAFTLTNTGNVPLTGIGHGTLGGTNPTEFTVVNMMSTCGAAQTGQPVGNTTLAPGATCTVTVQFKPQTGQTAGIKNATVSVSDLAGTQTSTLTGNANP